MVYRPRSCFRRLCGRNCVGWNCSPRPTATLRIWSPRWGHPLQLSAHAPPPLRGGLRDDPHAKWVDRRAGSRFGWSQPSGRAISAGGSADPGVSRRGTVATPCSLHRSGGVFTGASWSRRSPEQLSQNVRHRGGDRGTAGTASCAVAEAGTARLRSRCARRRLGRTGRNGAHLGPWRSGRSCSIRTRRHCGEGLIPAKTPTRVSTPCRRV